MFEKIKTNVVLTFMNKNFKKEKKISTLMRQQSETTFNTPRETDQPPSRTTSPPPR